MLSQGLARRLDAAYYLSSALIVVGMAASLLKGFDYEEATLLLLVLLALRRTRPAFDRRAAFFDTRFSAGWLAALAGALGAALWLGLFAFKHVDYADELWWQFELHGEASRFLRASVGAAVVVLLVGMARLLRHAPHAVAVPTAADLDAAAAPVHQHAGTTPNLVFLRDKALLFNEARDAFLMYGVQGRTWVAMGDPVGADAAVPGLIRAFLERSDDFGGVPVFYEIGPAHMHTYADFGLTFVKLGEEAKVDLATFTLEGGRAAKLRQATRRLEKDGAVFRVAPVTEVPALLPQLRAVSDDWLRHKAGAEKGFSLGFFDEAYLRRFPVAVVECDGQVVAFSNVWLGGDHGELSLDLMRYSVHAPKGVMEALLGLGAFLYEHGEAVYSFQGLRAFKEKFNPRWEPRYLAYPGGLRLARIVADSVFVALVGYLVAGAAEIALIRVFRPSERELAWVSDVVLSIALGVAVYLWRHLGMTRQAARPRAGRARAEHPTGAGGRPATPPAADAARGWQRRRMGGSPALGRADRRRFLRRGAVGRRPHDAARRRRVGQGDSRGHGALHAARGLSRLRPAGSHARPRAHAALRRLARAVGRHAVSHGHRRAR